MGRPEGRQVAKCHVLWEQQARWEVRQFTTFKKLLDLRTQGQAWGEKRTVRALLCGSPQSEGHSTSLRELPGRTHSVDRRWGEMRGERRDGPRGRQAELQETRTGRARGPLSKHSPWGPRPPAHGGAVSGQETRGAQATMAAVC